MCSPITHVCLSLSCAFHRMVALLKRDLNAKSAAKVAQAQQSAPEREYAGQHPYGAGKA